MNFREFMESESQKYPRTFHLPWSREITDDDRVLQDIVQFSGKKVVVTEKMDGENCTMYRDDIHARSLDSGHHASRSWVKMKHGTIRGEIPEGWRICGENIYAVHSIKYAALPSYFLVFSIWDEKNHCLDWGATKEWCQLLDLKTVPELYVGEWDEKAIRDLFTGTSKMGGEQEGYVVRTYEGFPFESFKDHVAKFVRKGHVKTDQFWMSKPVEPNKLGDY